MRPLPSLIIIAALVVLQACGDDSSGDNSSDNDSSGDNSSDNDSSGDYSSDGVTEDVESITVEVDALTFDALAAGPENGEIVLLLHGFPQTSQAFEAQVAALGDAGYRAVAPDQRGYSPGARPTEVEEYRLPNLVDDVLGMADSLGANQFHLVGHNWGAMVAWHVAAAEPDRLASLSVLSVPHPEPFRVWLEEIGVGDAETLNDYLQVFEAEGLEDQLTANDAALLQTTFMSSSAMPVDSQAPYLEALGTPEAMAGALNWFRAVDDTLLEELDPVTAPTLYIWSTDDLGIDRATAETTEDHVDEEYCFEELEGVSHWIPEEAPEELSALLLDHLDGGSC